MSAKPLTKREKDALLMLVSKASASNNTIIENAVDVQRIKSAIARIEAEIPNLKMRNAIEKRLRLLEALKIAIAPHKTLPADILVEIFHHCVAPPSLFLSHWGPSGVLNVSRVNRYIPWKLRQVCSVWRSLVIGSHGRRLWNRITIPSPYFSLNYDGGEEALADQRWSHIFERVEKLLPQDGPISLSFVVDTFRVFPTPTKGIGSRLIQKYSSRLTGLAIVNVDEELFGELLEGSPDGYPSLTDLRIQAFGPNRELVAVIRASKLLSLTPTLTRLSIDGSGAFLNGVFKSRFPWQQLTSLAIEQERDRCHDEYNIPLDTLLILRVLNVADHLLTLSISTIDPLLPVGEADNAIHNVTLPHLQTLSLELELNKLSSHLLDYMTLPSLENLELLRSRNRQDIMDIVTSTNAMMERSGCRIKRFDESPGFPDGRHKGIPISKSRRKLEKLFNLLSHVEELRLMGIVLSSRELERIASFGYFPAARSLSFPCDVGYQEALDYVEPRLSHNPPPKVGRIQKLRMWSYDQTQSPKPDASKGVRERYYTKYEVTVDVSHAQWAKRPH